MPTRSTSEEEEENPELQNTKRKLTQNENENQTNPIKQWEVPKLEQTKQKKRE